MNVDSLRGRATEPEIAQCERAIGRAIPAPYRDFLKRTNGGVPIPRGFKWKDERGNETEAQVLEFLGVHDGEESIAERFATFGDRIPPNLVPIASEMGGNLVLMGNDGRIFYWDHNWAEVHPLARSFDEFVGMLTETY